ncbi:MAG: hypothetical protein HKN11_11275 [Rhizobiales bacterium]|nr:hypothetical protein [Hyphomicrobiales bacterium]
MHRQIGKQILIVLLVVGAMGVMAFAGVMWRLSQGPLPLSFLAPTIQNSMNANMAGMKVTISDFILERDQTSGQPRFRLRDLALHDNNGNLIARAPRASVGVDGRQLLTGTIAANRLELIGANLLVRRKVDGTFRLGFGETQTPPGPNASGKSDSGSAGSSTSARQIPAVDGVKLLELINDEILSDNPGQSTLSGIEAIVVSQASISLFDEANNAVWYAPRSNLVFKRATYGFAVFVDAAIASGDKPWRSEVVVTYRRANRAFTVSARVFELVVADIADDIFALNRLTQVKLPLSGHVEVEITEQGVMTRASAELSTAKGRLDFPQYISKPILIDEGLLRFDYEPETGDFVIANSAIFIEGMRSDLQGRIQPKRTEDGRLTAFGIDLKVANQYVGSSQTANQAVTLDRIEFRGVAGVDKADVQVDDLILMKGNSGVRIRGRFVGDDNAVGMYLAGRIRDLSMDVVKDVWPPVVAPSVRTWLLENLVSADITDGTFQLALPGKVLVAAIRDKVAIPNEMIDLKFKVANVTTKYFGELPAITGAAGSGSITGNDFHLELADGTVTLPSGGKLKFVRGTMDATDLAPPLTPTVIKVKGRGPVRGFMELLDQKPLGLVKESGFDPGRIKGDTDLDIRFDLPLQKNMRPDLVKITAGAKLSGVSFKKAFGGLDIDSGKLSLKFGDGEVSATGPVNIKGIPVKLGWTRTFAKNGADLDAIAAEAVLNDKRRRTLGIDLSSYLTGPVSVKMKAETRGQDVSKLNVTADLTKAALRLDAIKWSRPAGQKTKAVLDVDLSDAGKTQINNLKITGQGLKIAGNLTIGAGGDVLEATFSDVLLNKLNHFAIALKRRNDNLALAITGKAFDARPLINSMFSASGGPGAGDVTRVPLAIETSVARVHANRGEIITNLTGQLQIIGGVVQQANLQGRFLNGAPITMRVSPGTGGVREMRVVGNDAGGALRAANLYSKISGGSIDFQAKLHPAPRTGIQKGQLVVRNFLVLNESAIGNIKKRKQKAGPRKKALQFTSLVIPFSTTEHQVLIGDARMQGIDVGAAAGGIIWKKNGGMDISGTITPAPGINSIFGEFPIIGQILSPRGQGLFAMNFALRGTMSKPRFRVDPVSVLTPGILGEILSTGGGGVAPDGTPEKKKEKLPAARRDQ